MQTKTSRTTTWVVIALTGVGSLMAALDALVVTTRAHHDPGRPGASSSSWSGRSTRTT